MELGLTGSFRTVTGPDTPGRRGEVRATSTWNPCSLKTAPMGKQRKARRGANCVERLVRQ